MKIKYDDKQDAIYLILSDDDVLESEEQSKDVIVDYNQNNEVVAIKKLIVK